jgi:hypothetical protein
VIENSYLHRMKAMMGRWRLEGAIGDSVLEGTRRSTAYCLLLMRRSACRHDHDGSHIVVFFVVDVRCAVEATKRVNREFGTTDKDSRRFIYVDFSC